MNKNNTLIADMISDINKAKRQLTQDDKWLQ